MEIIGLIIGWVGTAAGVVTSLYLFRRARRAEVGSKEIATADQMVELVKKAFQEALDLNKKENEKLRKVVARLERALRAITTCAYRGSCPVSAQLQDVTTGDDKRQSDDGQRAHCRDPA